MIHVGIIEDKKVIREAYVKFLSNEDQIVCTNIAESVEQFFAQQEEKEWKIDIVLCDIGLPGANGIEAIKRLKREFKETQVIMITVYDDYDKIYQSLCAGALGYLVKNTALPEIVGAIKQVQGGGSPMSPVIARKVIEHFNPKEKKSEYQLTPKEQQVVQGIIDGLSYKLIASRLQIGIDAVRFHIRNIYRKLQVNSKGEVISKAYKGEI